MTRRDDDTERITDAWRDRVGELFDLEGEVAFLPPPVQVGWMEPGQVAGGFRYCLQCFSQQPTADHSPVYRTSYFATLPCVRCGRRLDSLDSLSR
ncbi:MAG TPA: hypothetical protein VIY07_02965 [Pseudolabrys sp.]